MPRHAPIVRALAMIWLSCTVVSACAVSKKIADDIMTGGPELRRKVAILPTTAPRVEEALEKLIPAIVANYLERNCADGLFIEEAPGVETALAEKVISPGGIVNTDSFPEVARQYGLSALIVSRVEDIHLFEKKEGLWGFRDLKTFLSMTLRFRIYDVQTTALILDDAEQGEMVLPESAAQEGGVDLSTIDDDLIRHLLFQITDETTEHACEILMETPWKGFIAGSDGEMVRISAGRDVGLKVGDTLEVFAKAEPIQGFNERTYFVRGPKMGEVTVKAVFDHHSQAVNVSGDDLEDSACVMLKP